MGTLKIIRKREESILVDFASCLKCGSDDITFHDCGYSSFNVAYGECKSCKNRAQFVCGLDVEMEGIIRHWNQENDIDLIRSKKEKQMETIQMEIVALEALREKRRIKK